MRRSAVNLTLVIGIIFVAAAALGVGYLLLASRPDEVAIVVPKEDVPPFRAINPKDQFTTVEVLDDPIFENALTPEKLAEMTGAEGNAQPVFSVQPLPAGEPIAVDDVEVSATRALQVVSADEVLVGVSTTVPGALSGALEPGRVVTLVAQGDQTAGTASTFAKLISIGDGNDARGVAGVEKPAKRGDDSGTTYQYQAIVAIPRTDEGQFAGREVAMSLQPYCHITDTGAIVATDGAPGADACPVPAQRAAGAGN